MSFHSDESDPELTFAHQQPIKLRTRIMASGYKYEMLNNESHRDFDVENDGDLRRRSTTLCRIICVLGVFSAALLIALTVLIVHRDQHSTHQVCLTPSCARASASLLEKMDLSADPCEDMYKYACGQWLTAHSPPLYPAEESLLTQELSNQEELRRLLEFEGSELTGVNSTAVAKLKALYRTCMDEEALEEIGASPLLQWISSMGSWTVTTQDVAPWDRKHWSITESLKVMHPFGHRLFVVYLMKDSKNASQNILTFQQSNHPRYLYLSPDPKYKAAYLAMAVSFCRLLGGDTNTVIDKITEVFEFEKKMAKIMVSSEDQLDPNSTYNKMKLSELQNLTGPWINLTEYLEFTTKRTFTGEEYVNVRQPSYFKKLCSLVLNTDKEVLANDQMWNAVASLTPVLPWRFSMATLLLDRVMSGAATVTDRWQHCTAMADGALPFASGALFVARKFSPLTKEQIGHVLEEIRSQFIDNLAQTTWLDRITRDALREKAEAMSLRVGYPDWIMDPHQLDERYQNLEIVQGRLFDSLLNIVTYTTEQQIQNYDKKPHDEWPGIPLSVNAFYEGDFNEIFVNAGILQLPVYSPDFPDPLVYGAIGSILGHELTHGFDSSGRHYDKEGNLAEMWTQDAANGFTDSAKCMVNQYNEYTVQEGLNLNGVLTLGENIADNGGVKFAYRAMKSKAQPSISTLPGLSLTDDQLFFVAYSQLWCGVLKPAMQTQLVNGDKHAIGRFRVTGALSNFPPFARAFQCPLNSTMNPEKKCKVW